MIWFKHHTAWRAVTLGAAVLAISFSTGAVEAKGGAKTDAQVRQMIIQESIDSYSGSCPCPYNTARNGSSCGGRSAYSRPGGESPKCYASDVSQAEVAAYRRARGIPKA